MWPSKSSTRLSSVRRLPKHKKLRCPSIRLGKSLAIGCGIRKSDKFPWYNASIEEVHSTIITKKIRHWWVTFAIKTTTTNKQTNSLTVRLLKDGRVVAKLLKNKHIFHWERLNFRPFATTPVLLSYRGAVLSPWISDILKCAYYTQHFSA